MEHFGLRLGVAILTFTAGVTAASSWRLFIGQHKETISRSSQEVLPSPMPVQRTPCSSPDSPIRHIKFKFGGLINYGDVTGNGQEEAMMHEALESRGSAIPYRVYVYSLRRGRPKLLWRFDAGDRGEGGLRGVYADHGDLVVELYGRNSTVEDPYGSSFTSVEDGGACCAKYFTRNRYEWKGVKFRRRQVPEILPNPSGGASPEMYQASLDGPCAAIQPPVAAER